MRETSKTLELNKHRYQIMKMDPRTGSWLAVQLASYLLPSAVEASIAREGVALPEGAKRSAHISEADFRNLQNHCLASCHRLEPVGANGEEVAQPIVHASGRFNFPDLETDAVTILILTVHALVFNVAGFFDPSVQKEIEKSFSALSLPTAGA